MNKIVHFLFPDGTSGEGKIIDTMSNNRYLIKITRPKNSRWSNDSIDVDEQDIQEFYTGEIPRSKNYIGEIPRSKKLAKPKTKRCKCRK